MVAFTMFMCFCVFAFWLGKDTVCLKLYKLALTFYLMAVFVIGGLEISIIFFHGNVWADISARILIFGLFTLLLHKYVRKSIQGFGSYVEREADTFSVVIMIICILLDTAAYLSGDNQFSPDRDVTAPGVPFLSAYREGEGI